MKLQVAVCAVALALAGAIQPSFAATPAPADGTATASLQGDALRPAGASGWVRSELYFGVGRDGANAATDEANAISDTRWRTFLDKEVSSRFPDGLTVFDAYGQWLSRGAEEPGRLRTKVLVILHENTPQRHADIEAIRLAWKQGTKTQSVLWSQQAVAVSF